MATILDFPNIVPESIDFRLMYVSQAYVSPFGGTTQTSEVPGARWAAKLNFTNLQPAEQRELSAFLISLRGMAGRFTMYDFSLPNPQAVIDGSVGSISNTSVDNTSFTPTATQFEVSTGAATNLRVGDYVSLVPNPVGGQTYPNSYRELKMITAKAGDRLTVEPPFRVVPTGGEAVAVNQAKGIFMLDTDDQGGWSASTSIALSNITISCIEAF